MFEGKIKLETLIEHADGSASCSFTCDDGARLGLTKVGLISLLKSVCPNKGLTEEEIDEIVINVLKEVYERCIDLPILDKHPEDQAIEDEVAKACYTLLYYFMPYSEAGQYFAAFEEEDELPEELKLQENNV